MIGTVLFIKWWLRTASSASCNLKAMAAGSWSTSHVLSSDCSSFQKISSPLYLFAGFLFELGKPIVFLGQRSLSSSGYVPVRLISLCYPMFHLDFSILFYIVVHFSVVQAPPLEEIEEMCVARAFGRFSTRAFHKLQVASQGSVCFMPASPKKLDAPRS